MGIQDLEMAFRFVGGLGMFLYGMHIMAEGLQHTAGGRMQRLLGLLTKNRLMGILMGAVVTAVIQSSSATTVMVVGFVNAGIIDLAQAVGVIMGANIGTTATAWLVSMNQWGSVLKPEFFAPLLLGVGAFILLFVKSEKRKQVGEILVGFSILFIGLSFMSDSIAPYRDSPLFSQAFTVLGRNPLLAILAGAVVTAVIQSSSVSVGILQTMALNGMVSWNSAIFITLGQNIGTCITAILSGAGAGRNGRRASMIHLLFNMAGSLVFSVAFLILFQMFPQWGAAPADSVGISVFHTIFNITSTILLLPFGDLLVKLSDKLVPKKAAEARTDVPTTLQKRLDRRILANPSFAILDVQKEIGFMGQEAMASLELALEAVQEPSAEKAREVMRREQEINEMERLLTSFLVEVDNLSLTEHQHEIVKDLFYSVSDIERVGDHSENIAELAEEMAQAGRAFSQEGITDIRDIASQTIAAFSTAVSARVDASAALARQVYPLEQLVDKMEEEMRDKHIERLSQGTCNPESGVLFLDVINNLERIADHATNLADYVISEDPAASRALPHQ